MVWDGWPRARCLLALRTEIPTPSKVVSTTNGKTQGLVQNGVQTFKGIRYGAEPVGAPRFMPPRKPEPWKDVVDATDFGAPAIQMASGAVTSPMSDCGRQLSTIYPTPAEMKIDNEDCLFLNVWTPALGDGKKRPVMVWLHGGGYAYGSGAWPIYDETRLSRKGEWS